MHLKCLRPSLFYLKMIKQVFDLSDFKHCDATTVKIRSLAVAYGFRYTFCTFWLQYDGAVATAAICKFYGAVTIGAATGADIAEIADFLSVIGFSEVTAPFVPQIGDKLCTKQAFAMSLSAELPNCEQPDFAKFKSAYEIFSSSDSSAVTVGGFDEWYTDVSHRVRHGAAQLYCNENSTAIVLLDGENYFLNGIAVNREKQGRGLGKQMLETFMGDSGIMYTLCFESEYEFYKKCGFCDCGRYFYSVLCLES